MSVFDVLGATATIIQFIEYGIKFGGKAVAVYNGGGRFAELDQMTQDFQQTNQNFKENLQLRSTGPGSGEEVLLKIAEECQQTAEELTGLISSLSMKQGERSRWKALKSTTKTEYKKDEVLAKQQKFELLRKRCHEQLSIMISDRQFALAVSLARIERNQAAAESTLALQLTELKDQIISALASGTSSMTGGLVKNLSAAQRMATHDLPREAILTSLAYAEMDYRQSSIVSPSHSTHGWIFEGPDTTNDQPSPQYMKWLSRDDGVFWVTGKAGSGKSTLMKHIYKDKRTHSALKTWANGRRLFTASHYFWYAGSQVEKSYSGLMRSILYKILYSCPDLIESVCKERWREELRGRDTSGLSWGTDELQVCLDSLVSRSLKLGGEQICFCFFIDGLDEYDGGREVINALARLSQSGHTKICASSRPWNRFTDAFSASKRQGNYLELHQYTRDDIAMYVKEELGSTLFNLRDVYEDWEPLVREVIDRSEGVFLWVALVVKRELRPMLEDRESIVAMLRRLDEVPGDLHQYFQRIFERIWAEDKRANERYGADTAKIFKSCIAANEPLPAAVFPVIVNDSPHDMAISAHVEKDFVWNDPVKIDIIRAQVNRRCQDLLSVAAPSQSNGFKPKRVLHFPCIEFLHRSVQDFLRQCKPVSEKLERLAGQGFNADRTLLACYIFMIKKSGQLVNSTPSWSTRALLCLASIGDQYDISAQRLLQELDTAMQLVLGQDQKHWSNRAIRAPGREGDSPLDIKIGYSEGGSRNLVGHLIELNVVHPIREILASGLPAKCGRPLLDYALRINSSAAYSLQYPDPIWQFSANPAMVELLLSMGCDVNEPIHMYEGHTVWYLYLASLSEQSIQGGRHCKITWLLINHGAKPIKPCSVREGGKTTYPFGVTGSGNASAVSEQRKKRGFGEPLFREKELSMKEILTKAFGEQEAENMCERVTKNEVGGGWWVWPTSWK